MTPTESDREFVRRWAALLLVLAGLTLAQARYQAERGFYPEREQAAVLSSLLRDYYGQNNMAPGLPSKRVAEYLFGHGRTDDLESRQRMAWLHKVIDSLESPEKKS